VACNENMTLILVQEKNGSKTVYQLGGSNMMDKQNVPGDANECSEVRGLSGLDIESISCGDHHAAAIDTNGSLFTWGGGKTVQYNKGQCGHGYCDFLGEAKRVEALAHKRCTKVACGGSHTLVVTEDN